MWAKRNEMRREMKEIERKAKKKYEHWKAIGLLRRGALLGTVVVRRSFGYVD